MSNHIEKHLAHMLRTVLVFTLSIVLYALSSVSPTHAARFAPDDCHQATALEAHGQTWLLADGYTSRDRRSSAWLRVRVDKAGLLRLEVTANSGEPVRLGYWGSDCLGQKTTLSKTAATSVLERSVRSMTLQVEPGDVVVWVAPERLGATLSTLSVSSAFAPFDSLPPSPDHVEGESDDEGEGGEDEEILEADADPFSFPGGTYKDPEDEEILEADADPFAAPGADIPGIDTDALRQLWCPSYTVGTMKDGEPEDEEILEADADPFSFPGDGQSPTTPFDRDSDLAACATRIGTQPVSASIDGPGDVDSFRLRLTAPKSPRLRHLQIEGVGNVEAVLYDARDRIVATSALEADGFSLGTSVEAGTYILKVRAQDQDAASVDYGLSVVKTTW